MKRIENFKKYHEQNNNIINKNMFEIMRNRAVFQLGPTMTETSTEYES